MRYQILVNYFSFLKVIKISVYYAAIHYKVEAQKNSEELIKNDSQSVLDYLEENSNTIISTNTDRFLLTENIEVIKKHLSVLTDKQIKVIIDSVFKDIKIKDIAIDMNISQQAVSKTKIRALNKLKESLNLSAEIEV